MNEVQVGDGFVAPDRGHAAFVPIPKALGFASSDHGEDVARGMTPLLHRHWRHTRQWLARLMRKIRQITEPLDPGMPGYFQMVVGDARTDGIDRGSRSLTVE